MTTRERAHDCPECGEKVDICDGCSEIIHEDDPKAITGRAIYCHWCYKREFRGICAYKGKAQEVTI